MGNHESYGNPGFVPGYMNQGQPPAQPTSEQYRSAVIAMPSSAQMGGEGVLPWVRFPFYPTAPWYSTNPNIGYQTRFYSTTLSSADADFLVGSETNRPVQFDIPCRVIAINGAAFDTVPDIAALFINEQNMNLLYRFRVEYSSNDKLHTFARLASTVVGTARNPGELGGHGYNVDQGATLLCGITPLVAGIDIDITFVCLEMRGPRNFTMQRG